MNSPKVHSRFSAVVLLISFLLSAEGIEIHAEDTSLPMHQFVEEASEAWKKIADAYYKESNIRFVLSTQQESETNVDVCLLGKNELGLIRLKIQPDKLDERLNAINPNYTFRTQKNGGDSPWILEFIGDDPEELRGHHFSHGMLQSTAFLFEPVMVESSWLWDLVKSEKMRVISLRNRTIDNKECVELQFQCTQYNTDKTTKLLEGTILFDKKQFFVINEYDVQTEFVADGLPLPGGGEHTGSVVFRVKKQLTYQEVNGIPYPKTSRTTYDIIKLTLIESALKKSIMRSSENAFTTIDYEIINSNKVDESVFRLSHYGFSEPTHLVKRISVVQIVSMVIGLLLIVLGVSLRWFALKKS